MPIILILLCIVPTCVSAMARPTNEPSSSQMARAEPAIDDYG
ncbi:hypothetical protein ACKZDW_02280 (plasmid) [Ralstonia syzygii subsp. celebesensis]